MIINREKRVINGAVRERLSFNWPKVEYSYGDGSKVVQEWPNEAKQAWLINHGFSERRAYMIACNVSEADMQRIENN